MTTKGDAIAGLVGRGQFKLREHVMVVARTEPPDYQQDCPPNQGYVLGSDTAGLWLYTEDGDFFFPWTDVLWVRRTGLADLAVPA